MSALRSVEADDYEDSNDHQADAVAADREAEAMLEEEDFGDAEVFWPGSEESR